MIEIRGNIRESDYVSAQYLHSSARRVIAVMGVIVLILGIVATVLNFLSWRDGLQSASDAMMLPFLFTLLVAYFFLFRPWWYRRTYRKHPALHEPISVDIGEDGLAYSSEHGQGKIPWRMFIKWREGKELFLIYGAPNLFHIVPKRLLNNDDADQLRKLLVGKLGRAA